MSTDHTSRAHALLSASGATRWLNCTPSARLEEKFDESSTSSYAAEGTLAHEFGDINLRFRNGEITQAVFNRELKKLRKHDLYTDEMEAEVDKYIVYVLEALSVTKADTPDARLIIEERLDFSEFVERGFGTGDATVIGDGILDIIDLKYGKGVKVDAPGNPQLRLYGLGALRAFELLYDIHTVRMHIVQPRLDHISVEEMSVDDLEQWGTEEVKPKAAKAYQGKGVQKAGDWCKFCKVKAMCGTLAAHHVKLARHEFKDPHLLSEEHLLEIYKQQPMLVDWVNAVSKYITDEALKGKQWPGYKLVEGRSMRKWTDENKVINILDKNKYEVQDYIKTSLEGITKIEKLVGKEKFAPLLGDLVTKPQGKPTLVDEGDKRPALGIAQAKEDFKD